MLSGKLPFEGESMAQLMFKIANEAPTPISSVNPEVPAGLVAFLDRAMAKDPDQRFQTGEEFAGALRAAFAGTPAAAPAGSGTVDIQL
jgi:serine/threonine protein kinase